MESTAYIEVIENFILVKTELSNKKQIVDKLNQVINNHLIRNNLIVETGQIERVQLIDDVICLAGHATAGVDWLSVLLGKIFKNIQTANIYETLTQTQQNRLPNLFILNASQAGGSTYDELGIDGRVKVFCDAVSSLPNTETFSSCDGHGERTWYVLWAHSDNDMSNLDIILDSIIKAYKNTYLHFKDIDVSNILKIHTLCGTNNWLDENGNKRNFLRSGKEYKGPHFEIRIGMYTVDTILFYKLTDYFSEQFAILINKEKDINGNS